MKKLVIASIIFAAGAVLNNHAAAQSKPVIQVFGGYSVPLLDLSGDVPSNINYDINGNVTTSFKDSNTYLTKHGFIIGATLKLPLSKKGDLWFLINGFFHNYSSSQKSDLSFENSANGSRLIEPSIGIVTVGFGIQSYFLNTKKIRPYVSGDFNLNFISGKTHINYASNSLTYDSTYNMNSTARFGIGLGSGVEIAVSKRIGIVLGIKYTIEDLIRKAADTTKILGTTPDRTYNLNDGEFTYRGEIWPAKVMGDFQILAGISYYFIKVKKKK